LDNYKSPEDNLANFIDENTAKNFIENQINNFYSINTNLNKTNKNNYNNNNSDKFEFTNILSLFINDFATSNVHLLRHLKKVIINVFAPNDTHILNYFQTKVYKYFRKKSDIIDNDKGLNNLNLDLLEKLVF
jgi:hypothetical protein